MKILLVNNHTVHLNAVKQALAGHELEIIEYQPGVTFNDTDKDMVVLSGGGGEGLEITDKFDRSKLWYQDEMNFVRSTDKPVLGICMGFEVIVRAYSGKIYYQPELIHGYRVSHVTEQGRQFFKESLLNQVESHYWYVPEVDEKELKVMARSKTGIEVVMHNSKKQLGTQFHPEVKNGTVYLNKLINQLAAA
jgi:anthranilate/para-aminobenzoate synthase component II